MFECDYCTYVTIYKKSVVCRLCSTNYTIEEFHEEMLEAKDEIEKLINKVESKLKEKESKNSTT